MAASAKVRPTFEVDKDGMAKVFARKGKAFIITELLQNAWDEDTRAVHVTLEARDDDTAKLIVQDDNPEGFKDLAHAYTLFAESDKKGHADKRGRFNLGEKLVIAVCKTASIKTTKGTVIFTEKGRVHSEEKTTEGSVFTGIIPMTPDEVKEVEAAVRSLIPPAGIETTYNFNVVPERTPLFTFEATLRTELADEDGRLKPTTRKCFVEVYEPLPDEDPTIYEMGIPVVATGDRWHVNIGQKVPLNTDRDNVQPAYLRDVRVAVLNHGYKFLSPADAKAQWVTNAMEDEKADPAAVEAAFKGKFGEKTVIFDPNDQEANNKAMAEGYTVVPGGALPKAAWAQVKAGGIAKPAGQVTPSTAALLNQNNPDAPDLKTMDEDHWPGTVRAVVEFAIEYAEKLMGVTVTCEIGNDPTYPAAATYCRHSKTRAALMLNVGRLGYKWFDTIHEGTLDLLFDEFGHQYADNHLDARYYKALRTLGAKAVMLALTEPDFFAKHGVITKEVVA